MIKRNYDTVSIAYEELKLMFEIIDLLQGALFPAYL